MFCMYLWDLVPGCVFYQPIAFLSFQLAESCDSPLLYIIPGKGKAKVKDENSKV